MEEIKGVHPYADVFPMASPEELDELTESIAAVGLIQPIVLTPDGLVLDGRNRLEACKRAGVKPAFVTREGNDDDYKEFVIGVNTTGRRESMTVQIAAAATALILGAGKRVNGQWRRGSVPVSTESRTNTWQDAIRQAGLILDELGPGHLEEIRDGEATLNKKYEEAKALRDRRRSEVEARIKAAEEEKRAEEYAAAYFRDHAEAANWLANKPEGSFANSRAAFAAFKEENAKAKAAELERQRKEEEARRVKQERLDRFGRYIEAFVRNFSVGTEMAAHPERQEILDNLSPDIREKFLEIEATYLNRSK